MQWASKPSIVGQYWGAFQRSASEPSFEVHWLTVIWVSIRPTSIPALPPSSTPPFMPGGGVGLAWRVSIHSVFGAFCRCSAVPPPRGSWLLVLVCGSMHHGKSMRGLLPRSLPSPAPYNPARISGTRCSVFLGDLCRLRPGNTCCHSKSAAASGGGGGGGIPVV